MSKKLTEMSLEELWQLFPIILTEHQEYWKEWYLEEEKQADSQHKQEIADKYDQFRVIHRFLLSAAHKCPRSKN